MKNMIFKILLLALFVIIFSACQSSSQQDGIAVAPKEDSTSIAKMMWLEPKENAVSVMQKAMTGKAESTIKNQDNNLVINKSLLEKELLFMPAIVTDSTLAGLPQLFGPKIVFFKKVYDKIYLFESMNGESIPDPYEPEKIISEFPIISEDNDNIVFDFKAGFDKLIVVENPSYAGENGDMSATVNASYLKGQEVKGDEFAIYHVAQLSGDAPVTLTFSYAFIPAESSLKVVEPDKENRVKFFETAPQFEKTTGKQRVATERIDISKPFTFYISSNTPSEFHDAIKEGILAWNKVFGKEVLKVEDAPKGVVAGNPFYSVFQWVGFDEADYAYATWFSHPTTGEVIRANVIIPSSFAVYSMERAKNYLEYLSKKKPVPKASYALNGFKTKVEKDAVSDSSFEDFVKNLAEGKVSDDRALKLIQRRIMANAMHEVGHDLGLRHNFSGNLGSKIASKDEARYFEEFFENPDMRDNPLPSSSIMDYLVFRDNVMMHSPGEYDIAAIKWGYLADDKEREKIVFPIFCTDEDADGEDADCWRHDKGEDPAVWRISDIKESLDILSYWIIDVLSKKSPSDEGAYDSSFGRTLQSSIISGINGLLNYVDQEHVVHSLKVNNEEKRRVVAAQAIASYLASSTSEDGSVLSLANEELLGQIPSLTADSKTYVMKILNKTRNSMVKNILSGLQMRMGGGGFIPGMPVMMGFNLWETDGVTKPIADALSKFITNHVAVDLPSENAKNREMAAYALSSYDYKPFALAKKEAVNKLNENISAIQQLLKTVTDPERLGYVQGLLSEEQTLLNILQMGNVIPLNQ